MKKLKVMTILGTRPEIIRLSACIKACDKYFDHILVHTGQNWNDSLNRVFFRDLELREPDCHLDCVGANLGETIGNIIAKSYNLLSEVKPDAVLILGDTNSALSALSAKRLKIPIFHMEAGNRCFDENLPEEINRRIVDHISDVNLCYTEHARKYLHSEGLRKEYIFVTGSPMREIFDKWEKRICESDILSRLGLESKNYILLSAHREENIDNESNFFELMNSVNKMAEIFNLPVIYSTHPRSKKFIEKRRFEFNGLVRSLEPFGYFDYNQLQRHAFCVVSDSGTLSEESAIMGFPAVSVRTSTERPEGVDKGVFLLGSISCDALIQAVTMATDMSAQMEKRGSVSAYEAPCVSGTVVKIIQGYTDIINRMIWKKNQLPQ